MEPLVNDTPTSSTQDEVRHSNAMERRKSRMTISTYRPTIEEEEGDNEEEDILQNIEKNTNRNMYFANTLYKTLCNLCNKKDSRLVSHYVKNHPEVYISRPSPDVADIIRVRSELFELCKSKISGRCFFCEENKAMGKHNWATHILTHTGEPAYLCTGCDTKFKQKIEHINCSTPHFKSIFDTNESEGGLYGFMCKECNYLQIAKNQLVKHLSRHHLYSLPEIEQHYEKVTLIPDFTHIKTSIKFDFIDSDTLFKCTICKTQSADFDEFQNHINADHPNINEYMCCCNKKLTFNGDVRDHLVELSHLFNHFANLYRCMCCDNKEMSTYYEEDEMLHHILSEHTKDVWKFQQISRQPEEETVVSEIRFIKYICNVCDEQFDQMYNAFNHFKANHPTKSTDINTLVTKRESQLAAKAADTKTSYAVIQNEYVLRQNFLCVKCDFESTCKEDLLTHHNDLHQMDMFEVSLDSTVLIHMEPGTTEYVKINEKFDRFLVYSCYQCYESNDGTRFICGTPDEIHDHWLQQHSDHPFRFYVETLVQCCYCDDRISTYKGMLEHIEQSHKKKQVCFFNVGDYNKCPLCDYSGSLTSEHFVTEHSLILEVNMFNPNRITKEQFQQLLKIDVHKKPMCDLCGEIFNVERDFHVHHDLKHPNNEKKLTFSSESSCKGFNASCCGKLIAAHDFYNHLIHTHTFQYSCNECNVQQMELEVAAQHDSTKHKLDKAIDNRCESLNRTLRKMFLRTKIFFGNGLVLYKQNLLGTNTEYDDSETFERYLRINNEEQTKKFNELMESS